MPTAHIIAAFAVVLLLSRWGMQLWLAWLNQRQVQANAAEVPPVFRGVIDPAAYAKSVQYTLARLKLGRWEDTVDLGLTALLLFSGILPWALNNYVAWRGDSAPALAAFLLGIGLVVSMIGWPLAWHEQFHLEDRFGFNTTTPRLWWMDRLKGLLLTLLLGYPLLVLILKIVRWTGPSWWLWAWGCVLFFQLLVMVLAPVLILPLFNKFLPLPEGSLKTRLLALAERGRFRARSIQVMDGSKRSRHSNAFFTGFGRFRKIVLFDTLIQQLAEPELEAVLAHEIGHFRLKHVLKMFLFSVASLLAAFYVLSLLAAQDWFYRAFGFLPGGIEPALLVFALVSGAVTFWFSPLLHFWSRRFEYQADAWAAVAMKESQSLVRALRKLNEKNLSNLTPHPIYSAFYYSHPTLLEREKALAANGQGLAPGPRNLSQP
jgi:STE24 endopeptidase